MKILTRPMNFTLLYEKKTKRFLAGKETCMFLFLCGVLMKNFITDKRCMLIKINITHP